MLEDAEKAFVRAHLDFYAKLDRGEVQSLELGLSRMRLGKGSTLHTRDSECLGLLLVYTGSLRAFIRSEDGREVTLYRLSAGEVCILSASCVLNSLNFDVSIDADEDSVVFKLNPGVFNTLLKGNVWVENYSYKSAVERFSDVMWAVEQILFMRFDTRLAIFLLDEATRTGSVEIQATHERIAKYVGSAREVVSRMLKQFEEKGLVSLSRGSITITDRERLKALV